MWSVEEIHSKILFVITEQAKRTLLFLSSTEIACSSSWTLIASLVSEEQILLQKNFSANTAHTEKFIASADYIYHQYYLEIHIKCDLSP